MSKDKEFTVYAVLRATIYVKAKDEKDALWKAENKLKSIGNDDVELTRDEIMEAVED
jgi:hypothetical protein